MARDVYVESVHTSPVVGFTDRDIVRMFYAGIIRDRGMRPEHSL